jgi:hypothetical protein
VAKSKLVRFLVVGIIVLVLSLSGEVLAQGTSEPTWKLVETRINPENKPTEFIVGVTPGYYSSPRHRKYLSLERRLPLRQRYLEPAPHLVAVH